jgi:protein-disulfide isomerase
MERVSARRWITVLLTTLGGLLLLGAALRIRTSAPAGPNASRHTAPPHAVSQQQAWTYGLPGARFTIVEYADLECPYCKAYFPILRQWIERHPDTNWQWQHLPLSIHDPSATQEARIAECAGAVEGNAAFWNTVAWIYQHTRGDGGGLPANAVVPGTSSAVKACLASSRPDTVIRAQVKSATNSDIAATPTLRLVDRQTGRTLMLYGPIEGDALASAIDLLVTP